MTSQTEEAMAPHSSTLAWKIPRMEEPGGLPSLGSHRVGHDWSDLSAAATAADIFRKEWAVHVALQTLDKWLEFALLLNNLRTEGHRSFIHFKNVYSILMSDVQVTLSLIHLLDTCWMSRLLCFGHVMKTTISYYTISQIVNFLPKVSIPPISK